MSWNLFSNPSKLLLDLDIVIFFVCGKTYIVFLSVYIVTHRKSAAGSESELYNQGSKPQISTFEKSIEQVRPRQIGKKI